MQISVWDSVVCFSGLLAHVVCYAILGLAVTALQAQVYCVLATWADCHLQLANFAGYLLAVSLGFVLHGAFTFRDHGSRDKPVLRGLKFILVSLISLGLNALWVQIFTGWLQLPTWTPIPFMMLLTPGVVLAFTRQWVF